ncbi:hypothetical protein AOLI_G00283620 [Acnodon oligacanthus]
MSASAGVKQPIFRAPVPQPRADRPGESRDGPLLSSKTTLCDSGFSSKDARRFMCNGALSRCRLSHVSESGLSTSAAQNAGYAGSRHKRTADIRGFDVCLRLRNVPSSVLVILNRHSAQAHARQRRSD